MPQLRQITTYPVKSLDPHDLETARVADGGTLEHDREYAMLAIPADEPYDPRTESASRGRYLNGKRTDAVHRLRSRFDPDERTLTLRIHGEGETRTFSLEAPAELNAWLSAYFDQPASIRRYRTGGHHDLHTHDISGPSIISTATLREVASWFPEISTESMRRRFRANLEVDGCPPFWEDRLFADHGEAVALRIGDVRLEGVEPCARCVVPTRDPDTGKEDRGFREHFIEQRRETLPDWLESDRFDTDFRLMAVTHIPEREWGKTIRVGDAVEVLETVPSPR